jgi:hypothetical protein
MPSRSGCLLCRKVSFPGSKTKSLHLKIYASKIMDSLSPLSFYQNNVQMSLVKINKTQELLISLE